MASIIKDKNGLRRIQFVMDEKRRTIRLGHCTDKAAQTIRTTSKKFLPPRRPGYRSRCPPPNGSDRSMLSFTLAWQKPD